MGQIPMKSGVILGADGKPLRVGGGDLKRHVATPSLVGLRNPWRNVNVAAQLTPGRLRHLLHAANQQGDMQEFAEIAEEIEERDAHYRSVLSQRKQAVAARKWEVTAAGDNIQDKRIADFIRDILAAPKFESAVFDLLDGIAKGYSLVEIMWTFTDGVWMPADYEWVDSRWVLFSRNDGRTPYLLSGGGGGNVMPDITTAGRSSAEALLPGKFIWHTPQSKSGIPSRGGLIHNILSLYMLKNYALRDWWAYQEVHGIPVRVGKYDSAASQDDIETLMMAVSNIASDAGCVIPKSMEIEFVNSREGGGDSGAKIFEMAVRWCDEQYSKVIIGQTMTTDAGSSRSQAEVHYAVRGDLIAEDARQLEAAVRDQLIRVVIQLNFGVSVALPRVRLAAPLHEDKNELAKRAAIAVGIGLPLSRSRLYADLGLAEPVDAADALTPAAAAVPAAAVPATAAENNTAHFAALDTVDAAEWEEIADSDITAIRKLLNKSATAADFFAAVAGTAVAGGGLNETLAEALAGETFAARVAGETGNDDD